MLEPIKKERKLKMKKESIEDQLQEFDDSSILEQVLDLQSDNRKF